MKITIAFLPDEAWIVTGLVAFVNHLCPGAKVRKSERHPPFKHVYLTTKKPENPCNFSEND